jgi:hypothetical protein
MCRRMLGSNPGPVLRIRDVYPGSRILIFTHPGSRIQKQQQKREVKKISCHTFLCSHKFHKIVNYFSFEVLKKKIWANFQRNIELFTKKIVKKLLKIWSWDQGSEIRDPEKTYSGSRIQGSKRHRIPDPQHCPGLLLRLRLRRPDAVTDRLDLIHNRLDLIHKTTFRQDCGSGSANCGALEGLKTSGHRFPPL